MATKIARGQSGQADRVGGGFTVREGDEQPRGWEIYGGGDHLIPNGWNLTESGQVTVPLNAASGTYYADYTKDLYVNEIGESGADQENFEFEVVCMTVSISATEVERNEAMGVVLLECRAVVEGGTGPFQYNWSALGGTIVNGQGTSVVGVNFTPGLSGSVSVSVTDSSNPFCSATDSVSIPADPIEFTVTPQILDGTGNIIGTRDEMQFTEILEAVADQPILDAPSTITFQLKRAVGGTVSVVQLTGNLVAGSNPPRYEATWDITRVLGRWSIAVESPHRSNTASFKVDKRGQIVEVANSWVGAEQRVGHGGGTCDDIVRYIYGYVGLGVAQAGTTTGLYDISSPSSGQGGMIFYRNNNSISWQHVGIDVGGSLVDQNCGCPHNQTDPPTVGSHSAIHPDLQRTNQNPPHYDQPPFYRDLPELVSLDGE